MSRQRILIPHGIPSIIERMRISRGLAADTTQAVMNLSDPVPFARKQHDLRKPMSRTLWCAAAAFACLLRLGCAAGMPTAQAQVAESKSQAEFAEAHVGRGYELVKDERYAEAAAEFQAALGLETGLVRARYQLAVCWFAVGKMQESRTEFERLQKETGNDPKVDYYLALLDLRTGALDDAIAKFSRLMADPPFADTAYYLGSAYLEKGELGPAEKWLAAAARLDPRDYRIPDHLARVYLHTGRKAEAENQFDLSAQLRSRYDEASRQAVTCSWLLETKPWHQAHPACEQLFDPNDADKLTTLGMLYGRHRHYQEAVQPLLAASRLDRDSSEIQHDLGLTYFRLQRYAEARTALEKAVTLRPDFFGSAALLGATLYMLGDDESAYHVLDHAHALNPEDRDTADLLFKEALILADREAARKKYDSAVAHLQAAARLRPEAREVQTRLAAVSKHLDPAAMSQSPEKKMQD
jgi:tetratricopeptide (TPR) repeat protein